MDKICTNILKKCIITSVFQFQDTQGSAKKRPALPEDHFDFDDPENGPSPSKRRMHDEVRYLNTNYVKGPFLNYVDKNLPIIDHLPTHN